MLAEGMQELGVPEVEELLLDWLYSLLTAVEQDWLTELAPHFYEVKR